ncbi:MAG: DNA cytosine methyltransferase [Lachnospiraceae bacterium]|nr:DNA cytosine methyltransferase [Lachnospiraceae bacterium]
MINGELIVDNFAGGGGASTGIEIATGVSPDIAINHDPEAIRMHKANHPYAEHYCEDVWQVDPVAACKGHPVGLAWFSPDCKHFSKAKGGKPKDKNIRGLAWVACRWAGLVRPRVIMLENVEEFKTWGPLNRGHHPIKAKQGVTFQKFVQQLTDLGYEVQFRELVAADYGAPTMRKRFFMIARCDGKQIVWPEPTHGPADSAEVKQGLLKPYVGAYTQLDFSLPCPSIFDSAEEIKEKYGIRAVRPLAKKTMDRIARGIKKFILDNPEPFLIQCNHGGERKPGDIRQPMPTITGKHGFGVVEPKLAPIIDKTYGGNYSGAGSRVNDPIDTITTVDHNRLVEATLAPCIMCNNENNVGKDIRSPLPTITTGNRNFVAAPILIQYHSETMQNETRGQGMKEPLMTVDSSNRYGLVTSFISKFYKSGTGQDIREPLHTVTTSPGHFGEVRAFLTKYYGSGTGQDIKVPLDTITAQDRFGLVTIYGTEYQIVDIGLRMLEPKELYGCQGFPEDYIIDHDYTGKTYPRSEQVRRCGNAVCPPLPAALVKANLPEMCKMQRMPNMTIKEEDAGQLKFA